MRVAAFAVVLASAACASKPPPPNFGDPLFDVVFDNEIEVVAKGPIPYKLRFPAEGDAIRLPRELVIGNDQLIGAGTCDQHSGFGLAFLPTYQIAPRLLAGAEDGQSNLDLDLQGPAIVRSRTDWTLTFRCGVDADGDDVFRNASGTTIFTMFPTGRIVRHDEITPTDTVIDGDTQRCVCTGDPNQHVAMWQLASHYAFQGVQLNVDEADQPADFSNAKRGCAKLANNHEVGIAFGGTHPARIIGDQTSAVWLEELFSSGRVENSKIATTSALMLAEPGACSTILAGLADPPLRIAGATAHTDDTGIYRDGARHDDAFDIAATDAAIPPGFAVSLDMPPSAEITSSVAGFRFIPQIDPVDNHVILYFDQGLAPGQSIHVDPR